MRRTLFLFALFCFLMASSQRGSWAAFMGEVPTGLLQLENKYTYYLYVPPEYSPEKIWPMVFLLGKRGEDAKALMGQWVDWAKKNQFFVLAVPNLSPEKEIPEKADQWLFAIKKEILERFRVDPAQILLVGIDSGGHYAAYLGTRYPEEFPAAALIQGGWVGPFGRMMEPDKDPRRHVSFYAVLDPKSENFTQEEAQALEFEQKGYAVKLDPLKEGEDFNRVRERMIQWFLDQVESRLLLKKKPKLTFKEKFRGGVENFFKV